MELTEARDELAGLLQTHRLRVVFAESCTAGLCSATMGQVDGISEHLCGSLVVYRPASKINRLGVPQELIDEFGCESIEVAEELAMRVIESEPEADWAASVVGHLAVGQSPFAIVAVTRRETNDGIQKHATFAVQLQADDRESRQRETAAIVLEQLICGIKAVAKEQGT